MKRKAAGAQNQTPPKKNDSTSNVSSDLRSKIGYKLQTLLNGMDPDCPLFTQYKKQLYADLISEPQYSEIIIDPSVVVKIEDQESEKSSDALSYLNSENFLIAAKSRLTELLHRQQESEGENPEECIPSSSKKSKQIPASSSTRVIDVSDSSNSSSSDVLLHQGQVLTSVIDDNKKSNNNVSPPEVCQAPSSSSNRSSGKVSVQDQNKIAACSRKNCNDSELCESDPDSQTVPPESNQGPRSCSKDSDIVFLNETSEDVAAVNSPEVFFSVEENVELALNATDSESSLNCESDEEVVFWCEKKPSYDVITLEEEEDSRDIIEELHACNQCGKTFRARFLLNFHLKMHGTTSFQTSS